MYQPGPCSQCSRISPTTDKPLRRRPSWLDEGRSTRRELRADRLAGSSRGSNLIAIKILWKADCDCTAADLYTTKHRGADNQCDRGLVSGIGAGQHQPVVACRNALNIDLTTAWSTDNSNPSCMPIIDQPIPHANYVVQCEPSVLTRHAWSMSLVPLSGLLRWSACNWIDSRSQRQPVTQPQSAPSDCCRKLRLTAVVNWARSLVSARYCAILVAAPGKCHRARRPPARPGGSACSS